MTNTKSYKIEFGSKAHIKTTRVVSCNTHGETVRKTETIKIIKKESDNGKISGYRKVNFEEQRLKEAYRKVNKMLGGN